VCRVVVGTEVANRQLGVVRVAPGWHQANAKFVRYLLRVRECAAATVRTVRLSWYRGSRPSPPPHAFEFIHLVRSGIRAT